MKPARGVDLVLAAGAWAFVLALLAGCEYGDTHTPTAQPEASGVLVARRELPPYEVRGRGNVGPLAIATFGRAGGDHDPDISPDGGTLVFSSTRHSRRPGVYMKPVLGVAVTKRTDGNASYIPPKFSPSGREIACASDESGSWDIWIIGRTGRSAINLTDTPDSDEIHPSWHPDAKTPVVVYNRFNRATGEWEIWARNRRGGYPTMLCAGLFPEWSPVSNAAGGRICFQRARRRGVRWFSIWTVDIAIDPTGHLEVGLPTEVVSSDRWGAIQPAFSPDGKKLVFATVNRSLGASSRRRIWQGDDIWCVNLDGTDMQKLTHSPEPDWNPVWAPGAKGGPGRIYFCSLMGGHKNVWSLVPALPEEPGNILPKNVTEADAATAVIRKNLADQEKLKAETEGQDAQ